MRTPDVDGYEMQSMIIAKNPAYYRVSCRRYRDYFHRGGAAGAARQN
jgi:hypothetical protein